MSSTIERFTGLLETLADTCPKMLAGMALYMICVGYGCMRPMLPGDRLEEGAAIEKLSDKAPPIYSENIARRKRAG